MDEKRLVKILDVLVKRQVKEALKSNKEIRAIIKEEVKTQLIKVLLENKIDAKKSKRTSQISELLDSNRDRRRYPEIKRRQHQQQRTVQNLSKDPVLNRILNSTPYVADDVGGNFTGNPLMDSMGGMAAMQNENAQYAQSIASAMGNVKVDINPDARATNVVPNNAKFMTDKRTNLKEYVGDDGFKYVDDRALFQDESMPNQAGNINLERALNRNYKSLLNKMDEKAQKYRSKPLN